MKAILETERLLLREFTLDDVDGFFRLMSDAEITRFTGDGCQALEEAKNRAPGTGVS
jgi:RimJ/RimL family protein N-acetyltransferase